MTKLFSPTYGQIDFSDAIDKIIKYIKEDPSSTYDIVVGSDSQNYKYGTYYVTAIIIHRKGFGGRFYLNKSRTKREPILRNRMYEEANKSIQTANKLMKYLKERSGFNYNLEIHVDIGLHGKTKQFINEITGMIKGVGYDVKIKPESYGATTVADRYT